jgi:hypothetical protein
MQKNLDSLFVPGKRYRVVRRTATAVSEFSAGEIVRFSDSAYSRYDCSTAFHLFRRMVVNGRRGSPTMAFQMMDRMFSSRFS